jgi:hypothetical protein
MIDKTLDRGYFMIANSTQDTNYLRLAYICALTIKLTQPEGYNNVAISTRTPDVVEHFGLPWVFDSVVKYEGPKGMAARSRVYELTPYKETVFLDSDLLFLNDVSHWWPHMSKHDMYIATRPMMFRGDTMTDKSYRKVFVDSKLPDFYSGFFYFKESRETTKFFRVVEALTEYPELWKDQLTGYQFDTIPTDEACALAAKMLDIVEDMSSFTLPFPRFTHMKTYSQGLGGQVDWTETIPFYYDNNLNIRIGPYHQTDILHYTKKNLITDRFIRLLEDKVCQKFNVTM